jgi:hypothetical protein
VPLGAAGGAVPTEPGAAAAGAQAAEARFALDQAWATLSAQRGDLGELQTRAKDLVGLLTLAGAFLGAFGAAQPDGLAALAGRSAGWQLVLLALLPSVTFAAGLWVLLPSSGWAFAIDSRSIAASLGDREDDVGFDDEAGVHLFYAESLRRLVDANMTRLRRRMWALWVATGTLAATTVHVVALAAG